VFTFEIVVQEECALKSGHNIIMDKKLLDIVDYKPISWFGYLDDT
jgi:hypothetical protein